MVATQALRSRDGAAQRDGVVSHVRIARDKDDQRRRLTGKLSGREMDCVERPHGPHGKRPSCPRQQLAGDRHDVAEQDRPDSAARLQQCRVSHHDLRQSIPRPFSTHLLTRRSPRARLPAGSRPHRRRRHQLDSRVSLPQV